MLFILQKTVKSLQNHLAEFLEELRGGELFEALTPGAVTHARAKLKHTAFIELNQQSVLPTMYGGEAKVEIQTWHGHRLLGVDMLVGAAAQQRGIAGAIQRGRGEQSVGQQRRSGAL